MRKTDGRQRILAGMISALLIISLSGFSVCAESVSDVPEGADVYSVPGEIAGQTEEEETAYSADQESEDLSAENSASTESEDEAADDPAVEAYAEEVVYSSAGGEPNAVSALYSYYAAARNYMDPA